MRLVLASGSPRRAELLAAAGFTFEVVAPDVDERAELDELPHGYVRRLAHAKAAAIAGRIPDGCVLGADTAVVVDGRILGKPKTDAEAVQMLRTLSGRTHQVLTAVAIHDGERRVDRVEATDVHLSELSEDEIAWYVESGEPRDKAGAYAAQGLGGRFVERINGSYSNVIGLPVAAVYQLLVQLGRLPAGTDAGE